MSALTLQVASDLIAAHIGYVTGSIAREPAMPFKPLATLPDDGNFNGGGGSIADRSREQTGPVAVASTHSQPTGMSPRMTATPASGGLGSTHASAGRGNGPAKDDPFDRHWPQVAPMTEAEGRQYEREAIADGANR